MSPKGYTFTPEQRDRLSQSHMGQKAWNAGTGGCKRGHDPARYVPMPKTGVYVCLDCKRENGAKYRKTNQPVINFKNRTSRYQMTAEAFDALMDGQNGLCAICCSVIDKATCRIDHNHKTGQVRGLLCVACNSGLGLLKESPAVLLRAVEYVKDNADPRVPD